MTKVLTKFLYSIKKEPIITFFTVIVLISFGIHVFNRTKHFQECDSTLPYYLLREFPRHQLTAFIAQYPDRKINPVSQRMIQALFKIPFIKNHTLNQMAGLTQEEVEARLALKKPIGVLRMVVRTVLFSSLFSVFSFYPLKSAFITAFTSTYSAGSGFVYGFLFSNPTVSYEQFTSIALIITQLLFHLSAVLLFLIITKLNLGQRAAALAGLLLLFSIGVYSYGYNLGLTIWNIFTGFLWLWLLVINLKHSKLLQRISLASGVLIFFNYLIVFYWGAFLLAYLFVKVKNNVGVKNIYQQALSLLRTQYLAILLIGICALVFYPPGGGNPVTTSFRTFPADFYYIILNFFSFYNHSAFFNIIQFIAASFMTAGGVLFLFKNNGRVADDESLVIFKKTIILFLAFFSIAAMMKVLGFAPARQILFLTPLLFVAVGIFLHVTVARFLKPWHTTALLLVLTGIGCWTLTIRLNDAKAKFNAIEADTDVKRVVIFDCSYDLFYKDWGLKIPVDWADNPRSLVAGETYLYISQTTPLSRALLRWRKEGYDVAVMVLDTIEEESNVYFSPYYPIDPYDVDNPSYYFTKPNNYYKTKFTVLKIQKI